MTRSIALWGLVCVPLLAGCPKKHDKPTVEPAAKRDGGPAATAGDATLASDGPTVVVLPPAPPLPPVPLGLPPLPDRPGVTPEAVALGELLFHDPRLSASGTTTCASCHDPAAGFAGRAPQNTDSGRRNLRRAPTLLNLAWHEEYGWDGRFSSVTGHLAAHIHGQLTADLPGAVGRLADIPEYRAHFARAGGVSYETALAALDAYVVTRYAGAAPWDRLERAPEVPADMKAGYLLFGGKAQCSLCHTPPLYTDLAYHRIGLIATPDPGRGAVVPADKGAFKTPTLRGAVHRTGMFHDGSVKTLDEAIDWHLAGGTGQGADRSIIDPGIKKIVLSAEERAQLGAFVRALSAPTPPRHEAPALPGLPRPPGAPGAR